MELYRNRSTEYGLQLCLAMSACICALFIFAGLKWLLPTYFVIAYSVLFFALVTATRASRDWLNPISLVIAIGLIRFSIPGCMIALGIEAEVAIFDAMGIRDNDWILGHVLALMALSGVMTGWFLNLKLPSAVIRRVELLTAHCHRTLPVAAILCMLLGLVALVAFIGAHMSMEDAIYTGEMRETEIQIGTGKYYRLAFLLTASSVVFSSYLSQRKHAWWVAILPAAFAMISFSVLGGRGTALVPFAAAMLVVWYRNDVIKASMKMLLIGGAALLPVFSFAGQMYRGGLGLEGLAEAVSLSSVAGYMEYALWVDWGNLHSIAAAVMIGPGVLEGRTFSALVWPLSEFLGIPGKSAGVYMVETLLPVYHDRKWAFHATLIGDAYLNFGLVGVLIVSIVFGIVLRVLYVQVRPNVTNTAIYALAAVYSLRLFYESIEKFPEMLTTVGFAIVVVQLSRLLTLSHRSTRSDNISSRAQSRRTIGANFG